MFQFLIPALATIASASPIRRAANQTDDLFHLFVFGDSYSSTDFDASSPPPSRSQPLGFPYVGARGDDLQNSPSIFNSTTSNGPNWPIYLAVNDNTTTTYLYDFAISGATISNAYAMEILNEFEPKYASRYGYGPGQWNSNNSIFASWVSINDINWCSNLFSTPSSNFSECLPPRLDEYFDLMDGLYNTGARNFMFVNMPPLWKAPLITQVGPDLVENYKEGVTLFNNNLFPGYVKRFTDGHRGARTIIYDAFSLLNEILDHPTWYGFKDAHSYTCIGCTNGTGDFWTNNYHPTTEVHERLARDMVANLTSIGWPVPSSSA